MAYRLLFLHSILALDEGGPSTSPPGFLYKRRAEVELLILPEFLLEYTIEDTTCTEAEKNHPPLVLTITFSGDDIRSAHPLHFA
jgi:hypothetical protein